MSADSKIVSHKRLYENRYEGNYMDTDGFGSWSRENGSTRKVREILEQVTLHPNTALDYGCGVGGWIGLISHLFPDCQISGVDISDTAIKKANSKYPMHDFSSFNGSRTPYTDESFDLIFSYHVLEHVENIEASICEISRLLKKGGNACIIFPCGNRSSLQEWIMRHMCDGIEPSADGRTVHFFEKPDGHLRRMTSGDTIFLFKESGLDIVSEFYSAQVFGWIDWLCRSTDPEYIKNLFSRAPIDLHSKWMLGILKRIFLGLNWLVRKRNFDLTVKRYPLKQIAVYVVKLVGIGMDKFIAQLSILEWRFFRKKRNGTGQFLMFEKIK